MPRPSEDPAALVVGLGNALRGDDAAGPAVAATLRERARRPLRVIDRLADTAALIDAWRGHGLAIVVDAVRSGAPAGTVHRFDVSSGPLPAEVIHVSSHAINLHDAVEIARTLGRLPPTTIVYGIEGERFEIGDRMSPGVRKAIDHVANQVEADLSECRTPGGSQANA